MAGGASKRTMNGMGASGLSRAMSALPQDLHDSARMVSTLRTLQSQLPATSLDIGARSKELGTIDSQRQRAGPNAGPVHRAPVGRPAILLLAFADDSVVAGHWVEHFGPSTILAWDWGAVRLILPVEVNSS